MHCFSAGQLPAMHQFGAPKLCCLHRQLPSAYVPAARGPGVMLNPIHHPGYPYKYNLSLCCISSYRLYRHHTCMIAAQAANARAYLYAITMPSPALASVNSLYTISTILDKYPLHCYTSPVSLVSKDGKDANSLFRQ